MIHANDGVTAMKEMRMKITMLKDHMNVLDTSNSNFPNKVTGGPAILAGGGVDGLFRLNNSAGGDSERGSSDSAGRETEDTGTNFDTLTISG